MPLIPTGSAPAWLRGLFAVPSTPMMPGGAIDWQSLDAIVDFYLDQGADGIVPASVVGEGDFLADDEWDRVVSRVVERCADRAPVVVGILEIDRDLALARARRAVELGARGLLVKPPSGGQRAVLEHFGALAAATRVPIVLLDYPAGGVDLPVETIEALVDEVPEVCGIKLEDEPTTVKIDRLRQVLGGRIRIFGASGGAYCLDELEHGADGFFTGCPEAAHLARVLRCHRSGDDVGAVGAFEAALPSIARERRAGAATIRLRKEILQRWGVIRAADTRCPAPPFPESFARCTGRFDCTCSASAASPARILLVSDLRLDAMVLERLLESGGHQVSRADGLGDARTVLDRRSVDVVIVDAGADTQWTCRLIEHLGSASGRGLPFIVAGSAPPDGLAAGGFDVRGAIRKPLVRCEVLDAVAKVASCSPTRMRSHAPDNSLHVSQEHG